MKVLLATPAYGGTVMDNYMRSVVQLVHAAHARGVDLTTFTQSGESLITRARNSMVATFLDGDWTDLLFIDGDIGFEPENAWRLLESGHDVCATPYPLKRIDWNAATVATTAAEARELATQTVINFLPGTLIEEDGFAACLDAGTGFMRISRSALLQLIDAHPELEYEAEGGGKAWALFDTVIEQRDGKARYLSEDYAFCRRWQNLGNRVMVDVTGPPLTHRGLYEYGAA